MRRCDILDAPKLHKPSSNYGNAPVIFQCMHFVVFACFSCLPFPVTWFYVRLMNCINRLFDRMNLLSIACVGWWFVFLCYCWLAVARISLLVFRVTNLVGGAAWHESCCWFAVGRVFSSVCRVTNLTGQPASHPASFCSFFHWRFVCACQSSGVPSWCIGKVLLAPTSMRLWDEAFKTQPRRAFTIGTPEEGWAHLTCVWNSVWLKNGFEKRK